MAGILTHHGTFPSQQTADSATVTPASLAVTLTFDRALGAGAGAGVTVSPASLRVAALVPRPSVPSTGGPLYPTHWDDVGYVGAGVLKSSLTVWNGDLIYAPNHSLNNWTGGTTISNLWIRGGKLQLGRARASVNDLGPNATVTIRNCLIEGVAPTYNAGATPTMVGGTDYTVDLRFRYPNTTVIIEDCEIVHAREKCIVYEAWGSSTITGYSNWNGTTVIRRSYIHPSSWLDGTDHTSTAHYDERSVCDHVYGRGNCTMEYCYLDGGYKAGGDGPHVDLFQIKGGSTLLNIRHNNFQHIRGLAGTSNVFIEGNEPITGSVNIEGNYFTWMPNYPLRLSGQTTAAINLTDNTWRRYSGTPVYTAPLRKDAPGTVTYAGNHWSDEAWGTQSIDASTTGFG